MFFCSHFCKTNLSIGIEEMTADGSFKISQLITYNKNKWNTYDRSRRRFCIVLVLVFNVLYIDIMLSVQQSNNSLVNDFSDWLSRYEWIPVTISSASFFLISSPFCNLIFVFSITFSLFVLVFLFCFFFLQSKGETTRYNIFSQFKCQIGSLNFHFR